MIRAFHGCITEPSVRAHAIINASNPELGLGSGVSGVIRDACGGQVYQQLVRQAWQDEFDEPLGSQDCLVTSANTCTAFSWVLHVPTVNYRKRDPETGGHTGPTRIASCFQAALEEATRLATSNELEGEFVLATPLLGAGHGGLGSIAALEAMMHALSRFRTYQPWLLSHVIFVALKESDCRLIPRAAERFGLSFER